MTPRDELLGTCECGCHRTDTRHYDGEKCCHLADPFGCDEVCHDGDTPGFDHFCEALRVKDGELGQAFAAYLGGVTGWDGKYEKVVGLSLREGEKP